ncbi:hypothetical protein [Parendozoicomonas haliclonae]|uniref:Uncharacterized protein n=1 Tax=Parendozoicomonas haliclonae TaxID=1960125 RepID=A0A1X7AE38_9GAMM|nr:hypothetical protein [Parendozoicomonas haliclonae]SMA32131.1 hypothetical protein EHSB41UT_00108 [Parendozoicomonas haliclonae]
MKDSNPFDEKGPVTSGDFNSQEAMQASEEMRLDSCFEACNDPEFSPKDTD